MKLRLYSEQKKADILDHPLMKKTFVQPPQPVQPGVPRRQNLSVSTSVENEKARNSQ